jgi:hypothetical protein
MTDIQRANQEALNTLLQYDRMIELIRSYLNGADRFRLRPSTIQELNRISIQNVENDAGRWRDVEMLIGDSRHVRPALMNWPDTLMNSVIMLMIIGMTVQLCILPLSSCGG